MALISGNAGNNWLPGTANSDRIRGLGGNDALDGRAGNDTLEGGAGRDTLHGGLGRDVLIGGLGRDIMYGGGGFDIFRFDDRDAGDAAAGPLSDVIRDFSAGDLLDLVAVDVLRFGGYGYSEPERGSFSIWQAAGNTYVTWNTFDGFHDVELAGFTGDPFSQIRWYEDDYLANVNTTGRIAAGQSRAGTIEVPEDADWFRITLTEGQLYTFDLRGASEGGGTLGEPVMELYDADGNFLVHAHDELRFFAETSGRYFIGTTGEGATGTYRLAVSARTVVDDYGNDVTTNGRISVGQTREGELGIPGDQDWFRIRLTEGATYEIGLRGASSDSGTLPDPVVILRGADGSEITYDDDGSGTFDSLLTYTAEATGIYFIEAIEFDGRTGTYDLSVELI